MNTTNTYQFTGRENDNLGFGIYFDRARYYSPVFQRFISQDPMDFAGGDANLYGYAWENPTTLEGPLGFLAFTAFGQNINIDFRFISPDGVIHAQGANVSIGFGWGVPLGISFPKN